MNDKEQWKDIEGYEGIYQVSNFGNVKRLKERIYHRVKDKDYLLKPCDNGNGYMYVCLHSPAKKEHRYIHRLVATAFIPNPFMKSVINHKDHDRSNNNANNLEWCSQLENINYSAERMKHPKKKCKETNTKEKYIRYRYGKYYLNIRNKKVTENFETLEDAVKYRNEVMKDDA